MHPTKKALVVLNPFLKWQEKDGAYVMTDDEKARSNKSISTSHRQ